jgi:16S rRNA (guanine966-N2)-methyltransferase
MDNLRIIAGAHKGRRLMAPPGLATRPLPDRIKQSLFDWLGQDFTGLNVVDCCAGSGSFGLEALSRGAAAVHCIEPGKHAIGALSANARALGNPPNLVVHVRDFQHVLPKLQDMDLIFADPPFPWFQDEVDTLRELLEKCAAALAREGRLVIRGERGHELPPFPGLRAKEQRFYGRSWVALLRK